MSDYLDKIQTQKKDGTPLATVPFRDSAAREDITTIQNELTTDTTTIEGNPLNFTTLSAQTAKSTILSVEPIQDLHGYDKPWVGGAGKNLMPLTVERIKSANPSATWTGSSTVIGGVTFSILTDSDNNVTGIKANGTATSNVNLYLVEMNGASWLATLGTNSSCIMSGCPSGGSYTTYYLRLASLSPWQVVADDIGNKSTFNTSAIVSENRYKVIIGVDSGTTANNLIFKPMIRLSTETDATFQPYTNISSISGRSEIGILGCGKNLLPLVLADIKSVNTEGTWSGNAYTYGNVTYTVNIDSDGNVIGIKANGTASGTSIFITPSVVLIGNYIINGCPSGGANNTYRLDLRDANDSVIVEEYGNEQSVTLETSKTVHGLIRIQSGYNVQNKEFKPMLRLSTETDDTFEPYTESNDLTISLGQTVYGGTLDVENGVLVVDRATKTINGGESNIGYDASSGIWIPCNDMAKLSDYTSMIVCDKFATVSSNQVMNNQQYAITGYNDVSGSYPTSNWIYLKDINFSSAQEYKDWLSTNNLQVIYPLATPITIQLLPNVVNLLKGVNNISTDGDKITLTYRNGSVATLADLLDLEKKLFDEEPYGFIEHMSILDPAQRIEYIGKNKNYKPVTVNLSGDHLANYNDWHDFFVLKENKPYMIKSDGTVDYALDPNDYTKKFDGSASDITDTTYTGGAFSWIPKIYKYEYVEGSDRYVYLSQKKLNDNYEAVGFIDENGLEHDGVWIPMFYGTEITQSDTVKIMSLATGTPSQSRDTATQKTYIENFSSQAKFFGGPIVNVLADLLIMLGKNSDIQAVFGTGNSSGGNGAQYMKANACINGGAFYGSSTNTALNKAFHSLVLLTQNQWQRDPYTLCYKGEYIVSPYYKYDLTGASYVNTGVFVTPPSSNNWVYPNKSVSVLHWGAIPVGPYSGSTTIGWADGQYTLATQLTDTTVRVVLRCGGCNDGRNGGVRCVVLDRASSGTYWSIGASPFLLSKNTKLM